ncbi:unnamed protein product [Adineta ricciae]|nr:unnamed protein product [Adineta ricciae]
MFLRWTRRQQELSQSTLPLYRLHGHYSYTVLFLQLFIRLRIRQPLLWLVRLNSATNADIRSTCERPDHQQIYHIQPVEPSLTRKYPSCKRIIVTGCPQQYEDHVWDEFHSTDHCTADESRCNDSQQWYGLYNKGREENSIFVSIPAVCSATVVSLVSIRSSAGYVIITDAVVSIIFYSFLCHGLGGYVGTILARVFSRSEVNSGVRNEATYGNPVQVEYQPIGIIVTVTFSGICTAHINQYSYQSSESSLQSRKCRTRNYRYSTCAKSSANEINY